MMRIHWAIVGVFFSSCAYLSKVKEDLRKVKSTASSEKIQNYKFVDKSGSFKLKKEVGFSHNKFVVKQKVFENNKNDKPIEKLISISNPGKIKEKLSILRPFISQYTVWFDKKKYFTELKVDSDKKKLIVSMKSPQKNWNGKKEFEFPKGTGYFCFYSQVIDCAKISHFLLLSQKKGTGQMNFHVIWEGYPYFQSQYDNLNPKIFSQAVLLRCQTFPP